MSAQRMHGAPASRSVEEATVDRVEVLDDAQVLERVRRGELRVLESVGDIAPDQRVIELLRRRLRERTHVLRRRPR